MLTKEDAIKLLTPIVQHCESVGLCKNCPLNDYICEDGHIHLFSMAVFDCDNLFNGPSILDELSDLKKTNEMYAEVMRNLESCCPYDNATCKKTECFINGGDCHLRHKKGTPEHTFEKLQSEAKSYGYRLIKIQPYIKLKRCPKCNKYPSEWFNTVVGRPFYDCCNLNKIDGAYPTSNRNARIQWNQMVANYEDSIRFVDLRDEPMTDNYSYAVCKCHTSFYAIRLPKNFSGRFNCPDCGEELEYYG